MQILTPFNTDGKRKVVLKCDACQDGMGAVLEQESDTGDLRPVLFWSSKFRKYEANYSISKKEALACVSAMTKLKKYLLEIHFVLQTDHRALESLLSQKPNKRSMARTERWREKLGCFDYTVEHIRGQDNVIADCLSRKAEKIDHKEVALNEEFVINSIKDNCPEVAQEYGTKMKEITKIIETNEWTDENKKRFPDYYRAKTFLTVNQGKMFYLETRYVLNSSL